MLNKRYPGISPFTSDQKEIFFGRENDINKLQKLILLRNQVLLYAKSGIGKTSLLNAGVLPKLEKEFIIIKIRFFAYDNEKSVSPIKTILQNIVNLKNDNKKNSNTILDKISEKGNYEKTLWYYFKQLQLLNDNNQKFILVFDQFEELFSYPTKQINQFKEQLYELTKVDIPDNILELIAENQSIVENEDTDVLYDDLEVKTVYAIRSDRLSLLNELSDKLHDIQEVFYELKPLDNTQAKQAIIKPAQNNADFETQAFEYDDKAVNKIINDLTENGTQNVETTQLQIVCQKIEEIVLKKQNNKPNQEHVTIIESDLPKFEDVFLSFYKDSINKIKSSKKDKEQERARIFIEEQLIRNGQRISLDEIICLDYVNKETLATLVNTYLLRAEHNSTGGFSYELSHDTLVSPIEQAKENRKNEEQELIEKKKQNKSYLLINLLQTLFIVFILAFILKYESIDYYNEKGYTFSENINIPFYLFSISIIVQFLGLIAGSKELIRERKLSSGISNNKLLFFNKKIGMLFIFSALQVFLIVIVGNFILKIKDMSFYYWLILFSSVITANIAGFLISFIIKSQTLVNTIIPLLLVPQIFLSGYLMKFQDLNPLISSYEYTPIVADLMPARWTYEALAVKQFKDNKYEKEFYEEDFVMSNANYNKDYYLATLKAKVKYCIENISTDSLKIEVIRNLQILANEFEKLQNEYDIETSIPDELRSFNFNEEIQNETKNLCNKLNALFKKNYNTANRFKDKNISQRQQNDYMKNEFIKNKNKYYNERLSDFLTNKNELCRILETKDNKLIRFIEPIFFVSKSKIGRSHLYAPSKRLGNTTIDTYWFNFLVLWIMSIILYILLILVVWFRNYKNRKFIENL